MSARRAWIARDAALAVSRQCDLAGVARCWVYGAVGAVLDELDLLLLALIDANSDQGSQFTSAAFTRVLLEQGITISMDGRGRALDNSFVERRWRSVKYEDIYLKGYASLSELLLGLTAYLAFYNGERPHPSLGNRTPDAVYHAGAGGGASIVDRFGGTPEPSPAVSGAVGEGLAADLAA